MSFDNFLNYNPQCFTLNNGLKVIFMPVDNTDLCAIHMWVKTGSIYEDNYLGSGISHFVEHMVFKGTQKRNYETLFADVQAVGSNINAYTSFDRTVYTYDGSAASAELGFDILSDMLLTPTFPQDELVKERDVILREIDMCQDDPDDQLNQVLFTNAFRKHPYRFPIIGIKRIFEQLKREDLCAYWHHRYPINNMTLIVVGNLDLQWVKDKVNVYFADFTPRSLKPVFIQREPFQLAEREERLYGNYQLTRGALAFKIPGIGHKDGSKLQVLSNVLGCGESSILYQKLREELRYVYSIDSSTWMADGQGLFWIQYTCEPDKRGQVEDFLLSHLDQMAETICEKHVQKALNQAIMAEIDTYKTLSGRAHHLGWADICLGDLQYSKHYLEQLRQLNANSVSGIVDKYFKRFTCTKVSLEPQASEKTTSCGPKLARNQAHTEYRTLANGIRMVLQYNPEFPKTHIQILSLGGALYEPSNRRGVSQLVATLLTKDTQTRSALEIAELVDQMGAQFNCFTGNNHMGLSFECLAQDTATACQLLGEALNEPNFREETFAVEKQSQMATIQEMMDDVFYLGFQKIRKLFFQQHPYSVGQYGLYEHIQQLTLDDCQRYFANIFSNSNLVISSVSPLPVEELIKCLEPISHRPATNCFQKISDDIPFSSEHHCTKSINKEQSIAFQAYPMAGMCLKDIYVADCLEEFFNGLSSPFVLEVREKLGLAYTLGATRLTGLNKGMLCLFAGTHHLDLVEEKMREAIQKILDHQVSLQTFNMCKNCLKINRAMRLQTIAQKAFYAGLDVLLNLNQDAWINYAQFVDQLTLDDFFETSAKYLRPELSSTLLISAQEN